ncbi:unnamed protein product, partial [Acanthocheilonema viteae]
MAQTTDNKENLVNMGLSRITIPEYHVEDPFEHYEDNIKFILDAKGLPRSEELIKKLFLAYSGIRCVSKIQNLLYPESIETASWQTIRNLAIRVFQPSKSIFSARIDFIRMTRQTNESVLQFLEKVKNGAHLANFKTDVEERIRDQLIAGLNINELDHTLRIRFPNAMSEGLPLPLKTVVEMALSYEQTEREVELTKVVNKIRKPVNTNKGDGGKHNTYYSSVGHGGQGRNASQQSYAM